MSTSISIRSILLGRDAKREPVLLSVTPPRQGERTLLAVENLLGSVAVPEPFSLDLAGDDAGVTLLARCLDEQVVRGQLSARYPQARIRALTAEEDPLRLEEGEQAWGMTLRASGPEYAPLRTFRDDDLLDPGADPLMAILGALSGLNEGERVVARLLLRSLGPEWSQVHRQKLQRREQPAAGQSVQNAQATQTQIHTKDGVTLAILGVAALVGLRGYLWYQDGELLKAALLGTGTALGLVAAGWGWWRWRKARNRVYDPLAIKEKLDRIAFDGEVQVTAILPEGAAPDRARELLGRVAAAYRDYDNPAGAGFRVSKVRPVVPSVRLHPAGPGLFGRRSVLGVREAAGLWHPPGARDETPLVARAGSRALLPSARGVSGGALVGETTTGSAREIRFPPDLLRRHHLYVARTQMGKSTLMEHAIVHKLREKAAGRDDDAIVVVDPHADLVESLLAQAPQNLVDQVKLIDLADQRGLPGVNLLDTRVFADRDRTADSVVRVAHGLWEQWGPRMQSILEHAVKSLHEANEKRGADAQYTIIDGLRLLSDDDFRNEVLAQVDDHHLLRWWAREFGTWRRDYQGMALAPVQTRLAYYASSKTARAILGQPCSTIDLRETIRQGGILLVSTAQGAVGRDVAALVGSSILNLVDAVIREQGSLPPDERRGALVVVDEMQTMPGVDYESMLSELGKFGASFILATQSLGKLEELSRTMRDTVLANVGCLAAFQMAGTDARQLVWELGKERVSEDDVTSLDVHQCYVRATVGVERMDAFSMRVLPPEAGDPAVARRIRELALGYITPPEEVGPQDDELRKLVERYREELERLGQGHQGQRRENAAQPPAQPQPSGRNRRRSKRGPDGPETGADAEPGANHGNEEPVDEEPIGETEQDGGATFDEWEVEE